VGKKAGKKEDRTRVWGRPRGTKPINGGKKNGNALVTSPGRKWKGLTQAMKKHSRHQKITSKATLCLLNIKKKKKKAHRLAQEKKKKGGTKGERWVCKKKSQGG